MEEHMAAVGNKIKVITFNELMEMDIPQREHLITPWLRERESALIYAAPGVGKSFFALSLSLAVAGGGELVSHWSAPQAKRVLYLDGEMPLDDIRDRTMMLAAGAAPEVRKLLGRNLSFAARQGQNCEVEFYDLAKEPTRDALLEYAVKNRFALVVLDNLSTLATIEDENAASAFNDTVRFLLSLKQAGIACVLVHHSGKNASSYRGSSKIATTFVTAHRGLDKI
jgi:RecA-family ATPase